MKNHSNKKIMIVEDSLDMITLLKELFEEEGYILDVATNGKEALKHLEDTKELPSVIFLDLMMPIMDGYQFREAQGKNPRIADIPIVVMTADGHIEEKTLKMGTRESIKKPMDIDQVLKTVRKFAS